MLNPTSYDYVRNESTIMFAAQNQTLLDSVEQSVKRSLAPRIHSRHLLEPELYLDQTNSCMQVLVK